MFVKVLHRQLQQVKNPTWADIETAIRALHGDDLHLAGDGKASMTISGGDDRFFAQVTFDGAYFHYLLGPKRSDELVPIVVGNQEIELEARKISDLRSVLQAARTFADKGRIDDAFSWELG